MSPVTRLVSALMVALVATLLVSPSSSADPLPGYDLDARQLEERMDACMAGGSANDEVLMAWVSFRDGSQRFWRCWALKHMLLDNDRNPHDPYADVAAFMRCMDKTVSYGFPRRSKSNVENVNLTLTWSGGASQAVLSFRETTGDIITLYTSPRPDDWAGCAYIER